jgi:hypothetical protein
MRSWLFHPLIFYPLAIIVAAGVIVLSLRPQNWPREPAPAPAVFEESALIFAGPAFDAPASSTNHALTVTRNFWGQPQTLRIGVEIEQGAPRPEETGVRLLLAPEDAARLNNQRATIEVSYNALPINTAQGLAVSLQGAGPTIWTSLPIQPQPATVRFEVPAQSDVSAIGLRAINNGGDRAFGLEITRIRVIPHA